MSRDAGEGRRGDGTRVADILAAAALLEDIVRKGHDLFLSDPHLQAASIRYLEVIGVAAGELSKHFREAHPKLPVRKMRGFANLAKHEYWRVDVDLLWEAVLAVPAVKAALADARIDDPIHEKLRRE